MEYEPKLVGFLCNWCTSVAADQAGVAGLQLRSDLRTMRMMCSGAVDPVYVLQALFEGADGVLVAGCHPGDCHYVSGNLKAQRRMAILQTILGSLGLEGERVWLRWVAASEAHRFAGLVEQMKEQLQPLGPCALAHDQEV